MRNVIATIAIALMSSSMLARAAAGNSDPSPGVCRFLAHRVDQCESGARLSLETRAACDRFEQGFRDLCGALETIVATESADSATLDLLRQDYEVIPIEGVVFPNHVVIGPSDLDDPGAIALLRKAYRAGRTVAITDATAGDARRFHRLIRAGQEADCAPAAASRMVALYGLQQSLSPPQNASYCLRNLDDRGPAADRRWLRERFASQLPSRVSPVPLLSGSTQALVNLAASTSCYFKQTTGVGNISWTVDVWAMRNFSDTGFCTATDCIGADYYLVNFNPMLTPSVSNVNLYGVAAYKLSEVVTSTSEFLDTAYIILTDADPGSVSTYTSTYTNSSSTTLSGSVSIGFQGVEEGVVGPTGNVTAGASYTTENSKTILIPPVTIEQSLDSITAEPSWAFSPQSTSVGDTYKAYTAWLWIVGRQAYPSGGTGSGEISFPARANIFTTTTNTDISSTCNVPYPFEAWTVAPPQLTSLSSTSVSIQGGVFTITGQYLYPASVSAVLIGGQAVPLSTNVALQNNTTIGVTVGGATFQTGDNNVQVNTQFNGMNRFSNTLIIDLD
jgi:hypothetical protein